MAKLNGEKKPPYFSKEAREARELQQTPSISNDLPTTQMVAKETPTDGDSIRALLKRIEELEKDKKDRDDNDPATLASMKGKFYDGPSKYAISLRGGIPILAWESFRQDPTKDFEYKNQYGQYETNHYMRLMMADGQTLEVTNYNFLRDRSKTDPMFCKEVKDESGKTTYVFDTGTYGQITILSSKYLN